MGVVGRLLGLIGGIMGVFRRLFWWFVRFLRLVWIVWFFRRIMGLIRRMGLGLSADVRLNPADPRADHHRELQRV